MPGESVRVVDGVFSPCLGLFEGMLDRERVVVLLELLGRRFAWPMDEDALATPYCPPHRGKRPGPHRVNSVHPEWR